MCRAIFPILLMLGGMVFTGTAEAAPCVADPVPGVIRDKWLALGGRDVIGCALTEERAVAGHDGRYVQFQNGQVVFSPAQRMVIAAWEDGGANGLDFIAKVDWTVLDTFSYDFFLIRWRAEGNDEDAQHTTDNGGTGGFHQFVDGERGSGHFRLVIEGCNDGGFLGRSHCSQSWSNPVFFDNDYIDISRAWAFDTVTKKWRRSRELPTPTTLTDALQTASARRAQATARECLRTPEDSPGEDNTTAALARLDVLALPFVSASMCLGKAPFNSFGDAEILRQSVSGWIENTSPDTEVGTDVDEGLGALVGGAEGAAVGAAIAGPPGAVVGGVIGLLGGSQVCSRDGDYDFALTLMMPIAFEHSARLDPSSYDHLLDTLLTERGGSEGISTTINVCGLSIDETENHILMTSTARYLTNMLLLQRAKLRDPSGTSQAFLDADAEFNNTRNGMQDWMLRHLQNFLKNGFHEFNARPYSRLSMMALQNIANYADAKVATAASMVLDLQGAHFAVSSSQLRRTPPFRRRAELNNKTELFGRYSDQETWRELGILGTSDVLHRERFGHAPWNAGGVMAFARGKTFGVQRYEQPEVIADLIMNRTTPHTFWQALGHEGYEVYVGTEEVFISGGGRWQDSTSRDSVLGMSRDDTDSNAMPTLLVPQFEGVDRNDMIRIDGDTDEEARNNTCVAPGFACGLNPVVPDYWLRRFPPMVRPCVHPVIGRISEEWNRLGRENGVIGCPLAPEQAQGSGSFVQEFERGQIGWSAPQKMLLSAHYNPNSSDIVVAWHIVDEFDYDFFIVRWDKNGNNIGQRDLEGGDDGTTDTSGEFAITPEGTGTFAFIVEGCESNFLSSSDCDEGFSIPLVLDFPSIRSCARANGSWVFVSSVGPCNFTGMGRGFYAAVYSEPCAGDSECEGQNFGFFETSFFPCFFKDGHGCESFDEFMRGVLASNGATDFTSAGVNEYQLRFPSKVTFTPDHSRNDSGVIDITNMERAVPFLLSDWHLARGHVIDADGLGCVVVRNRALKSALVLNMRDFNAPVRSLASSPDGTFSCALVP